MSEVTAKCKHARKLFVVCTLAIFTGFPFHHSRASLASSFPQAFPFHTETRSLSTRTESFTRQRCGRSHTSTIPRRTTFPAWKMCFSPLSRPWFFKNKKDESSAEATAPRKVQSISSAQNIASSSSSGSKKSRSNKRGEKMMPKYRRSTSLDREQRARATAGNNQATDEIEAAGSHVRDFATEYETFTGDKI